MLLFFNLNTKQVRFEDLELILNISTASTPGGYYCFEKGIYSDKPTRRLLIFIMSIPRGSERLWMIGVSEKREREIILDKGQNAYWMVDRYTAFRKFTVMIFMIYLLFVSQDSTCVTFCFLWNHGMVNFNRTDKLLNLSYLKII